MYLEKSKCLVIWNRGSIILLKQVRERKRRHMRARKSRSTPKSRVVWATPRWFHCTAIAPPLSTTSAHRNMRLR